MNFFISFLCVEWSLARILIATPLFEAAKYKIKSIKSFISKDTSIKHYHLEACYQWPAIRARFHRKLTLEYTLQQRCEWTKIIETVEHYFFLFSLIKFTFSALSIMLKIAERSSVRPLAHSLGGDVPKNIFKSKSRMLYYYWCISQGFFPAHLIVVSVQFVVHSKRGVEIDIRGHRLGKSIKKRL